MQFLWPHNTKLPEQEEAVLLFTTAGGDKLELASNLPYEVWMDGQFAGDGGWRCIAGQVDYQDWDATFATNVVVRLHWLNTAKTGVHYRALFEDAFLADKAPSRCWQCHLEKSLDFAAKPCAQLPRQNIIRGHLQAGPPLPLRCPELKTTWRITPALIKASRYVPVLPRQVGYRALTGTAECELSAIPGEDLILYLRQGLPTDAYYEVPEAEKSKAYRFDKTHDGASVQRKLPAGLACVSYDLGQIALHRFELATQTACILCYSEVADITDAWKSPNRSKVHLADAVAGEVALAAPFGVRGCRYVHLIYRETATPPRLRAWRRQYPFNWRKTQRGDRALNTILEACGNNLIACVDGGIVDTCWRERVQWTGDIRMSGLAMQALADNPEVLQHSLLQIADSYDDNIGMVQGAWPQGRPDKKDLLMPTYHLAFCLAVIENHVEACLDVVTHSVAHWQRHYLKDGLIRDVPGWHFVDWDFIDEDAIGRNVHTPHCVLNAWFDELCRRLKQNSPIDAIRFEQAFKTDTGYGLLGNNKTSIHATAAVAGSMEIPAAARAHCAGFLLQAHADGRLRRQVTAYYAYFVAKAIGKNSSRDMLAFIKAYYLPMAQQYHTLWEKCDDQASLAHGWSVGVAQLIQQAQKASPKGNQLR